MTYQTDTDFKPETTGKTAHLGFESSEDAMRAGIRVRPADLARLFGVTKQAVSSWVKDGRIVLGADGRADPREAVNRLIATGDPNRLRAVFLKPLCTELAAGRLKISQLEQALEASQENEAFQTSAALQLLAITDALPDLLESAWPVLCAAPENEGLWALLSWIETAVTFGLGKAGSVTSHLSAAPSESEKGCGQDFELSVPEFDSLT